MNFVGIAYATTILGSLNTINLGYFLYISRTDRQFWTLVNFQLLFLIVGCIGFCFSSAYCYFNRSDTLEIFFESTSVKIGYVFSFVFIAMAESAYLYHSWMRAKTILLYKNKIWYTVLNTMLKVSCVITFLPVPLTAIALALDSRDIHSLTLLVTGFVGLIVFIFDCFILYSFSKYFFFSKDTKVKNNRKNELIATFGTYSSTAVLLTTLFQIAIVALGNLGLSVTNVFLLFVFMFFQVPPFTFVVLKVKLKNVPDTVDSKNTAPIESNI